MKPAFLLAPIVASALLVATDVQAQRAGGDRSAPAAGREHRGGGNHAHRGGHRGHHGRGHRHGHGHWHGHFHGGLWSPYWAWGGPLYWSGPIYWGAAWGWPYYDYYPRETVVYREVPAQPEGAVIPPTTEVPRTEGAPTQGPLYMNYCESAKAYFPKVTSCPEGWRLASPTG